MTKEQLAKELKEKIREGIKPSDLKKNKEKIISQIPTPPDSPIITPIGKSLNNKINLNNNKKELDKDKDKKIKQLQQDLNF